MGKKIRYMTLASLCATSFYVKVSNIREVRESVILLMLKLHAQFCICGTTYGSLAKSFPESLLQHYIEPCFKDQRRVYLYVTLPMSTHTWEIHVEIGGNCGASSILVKYEDLRRFLMNEYVSFNGYRFSSLAELNKFLKRFVLSEFNEFLKENNASEKFFHNFNSELTDGFGSRFKNTNFRDYCYNRTFSRRGDDLHISQMLRYKPFKWRITQEGFRYWDILHNAWERHINNVFDGIEQPLTH